LPDELSFHEGALLDPASISLHAANRGGNQPGDTVVVFGPGPIGLLAAEAARVRGAVKVIVVGLGSKDGVRLEKALELGNVVIDLEKGDPISRVKELTGGVGADVVLDCAGAPASIRSSMRVLRRGGRCAAVGIPLQEVNLSVQDLVLNELELVGVRGSAGEMRTVSTRRIWKIRVRYLILTYTQ
jgi:L-iditol 2-dehydrogenase